MPTRPRTHQSTTGAPRHEHGPPATERQRTRQYHTGTKAWQAIRREVLLRDRYTCQECGRHGNQVDHVDGDAWNNPEDGSNWQTLCRHCHSLKTAVEIGRVNALPTFPRHPIIPVTVVCGPPGSGKSTYARERAGPKDLILDLGEIKSELTGCPIHESPDDAYPKAIAERNRRLASLSRRGPYDRCWFVVMAPTAKERRHWKAQLRAEVFVLEVSADECLRRIAADESRAGKPREYWERIIHDWWRRYVPG